MKYEKELGDIKVNNFSIKIKSGRDPRLKSNYDKY